MLCPVHEKSTKLALVNEGGTGSLCWLCEANRSNELLARRLAILQKGLEEIRDKCFADTRSCCGEDLDYWCESYGCGYVNTIGNMAAGALKEAEECE